MSLLSRQEMATAAGSSPARAAGLAYLTDGELSARLTAVKAAPERAWLGEVSAVVLQQSLADLNVAYRNFFASVTGTRKGPKVAPPRFKSRKDRRQAIGFTANARFKVLSGRTGDRHRLGADPLRGPVRRAKIASPRFLGRAGSKLKRAQRALSGKEAGSKNRDKARVKVARAHVRVTDARRDFHHQLSTALIRDNQAVAVEDLAVRGLARTRMAKSVHDAGWSAFVDMLEYKARRYGREFRRTGRFEPTSQVCSACGAKDGPKPLHVRTWQCRTCGTWLDRDVNAAVNVARAAGLAVSACGAQVRPGPCPPAQRDEAGTLPGAA